MEPRCNFLRFPHVFLVDWLSLKFRRFWLNKMSKPQNVLKLFIKIKIYSLKRGKPAFPAEPASPNCQCMVYSFLLLHLSNCPYCFLFLLFSVSTVFICAIYRVLSQLQIASTTLSASPPTALAASSSLFCNSVTWRHLWCHLRHL